MLSHDGKLIMPLNKPARCCPSCIGTARLADKKTLVFSLRQSFWVAEDDPKAATLWQFTSTPVLPRFQTTDERRQSIAPVNLALPCARGFGIAGQLILQQDRMNLRTDPDWLHDQLVQYSTTRT